MMAISVIDPISPAIARAKWIAFQPFDIGKWFTLGFVAFLAYLGEGGGAAGADAKVNRTGRTTAWPPQPLVDWWHSMFSNPANAIGIVFLLALAGLLIWLVLLWLSSRGKFMLLEAIANNTWDVVAPWHRYRMLGNSLFKFRSSLLAIMTAISLTVAMVALTIAWGDIENGTFGPGASLAVAIMIIALVPMGIAFAVISWITTTFVTIIMYARGMPVLPAWREFRNIFPLHAGSFILCMLLHIVLVIAVTIGQVIIGCVTCCIGFLPYISSVVTLPLILFLRSYSIYFFQQVGPEYGILIEPPPPPPRAYGFPVVQ